MSVTPGQRASDLAAQQVEQIVAAAQVAAEEIRRDARLEQEDLRNEGRRSAERILDKARKQAIVMGSDARREAEALVADAREESARIHERTKRAVDGRVAAAEKAAAEVLEEARTLSGGLRQLGKALEDHAERILRDVTAAHKRMQAELRVGDPRASDPSPVVSAAVGPARGTAPRSAPARRALANSRDDLERRRADERSSDGDGMRPRRDRLDDLEVPSWVAQSD